MEKAAHQDTISARYRLAIRILRLRGGAKELLLELMSFHRREEESVLDRHATRMALGAAVQAIAPWAS